MKYNQYVVLVKFHFAFFYINFFLQNYLNDLASTKLICVKLKYFLRLCDQIVARCVFEKEVFAKTLKIIVGKKLVRVLVASPEVIDSRDR